MGWTNAFAKLWGDGGWEEWALQHGWRYEAESPALAGRFCPLPRNPRRGRPSEKYVHVVWGEWEGLPFVKFDHPFNLRTEDPRFESGVAVQLPGPPCAHVVALNLNKVFGPIFGRMRESSTDWRWIAPAWLVATRGSGMKPGRAEEVLQRVVWLRAHLPADAFGVDTSGR